MTENISLTEFVNTVFGDHQQHALGWRVAAGSKPGYPSPLTAVINQTGDAAFYFGTATMSKSDRGELRNKGAQFKALHLIVLDDINTKIDEEALPDALAEPTYIIETSPDNYQFGYVLSEPVDNFEQAKALVQAVYESGWTDEGGKMPNKLVRLPHGVNGKPGDRFEVKLVEWNPDSRFSREAWEDLLGEKFPEGETKDPLPERLADLLRESSDPVLDWLHETGRVVSINDEWVTLECPWHGNHSDGGSDDAGYSPSTLGKSEYAGTRQFSCFHAHCEAKKIGDFLQWVERQGGPSEHPAPGDPVTELLTKCVWDEVNEKIRHVDKPKVVSSRDGFSMMYPQNIIINKKKVPITTLWASSKTRVNVQGARFVPSSTDRIVTVDGDKVYNLFNPPLWRTTPTKHDAPHIDVFEEFLAYLIPFEEDRAYLLMWLAAKARDMAFRGAGILMVARVQGTGRSTLFDIISRLFGSSNCERADFHRLFGSNQFNAWADKPMVMCDETLNSSSELTVRQTGERLKEVLDPRPRKVMVNPKYGKQYETDLHASFLMASNHEEALNLPDDDRRVYVIANAIQAQTPSYYTRLNQWLEANQWQDALWAWLSSREVDMQFLLAPAPLTVAKTEMQAANKYPSDEFVDTVLEILDEAMPNVWVNYALEQCAGLLNDQDKEMVKKKLRHATRAGGPASRVKPVKDVTRWRVNIRKCQPQQVAAVVEQTKADILAGRVTLGGHETQESFAAAVVADLQSRL